MAQKGNVTLFPLLIIIAGVVIGVYFIESSTGFLSKALDSLPGPSRSGIIKIPIRSPQPSEIATGSAQPATASGKPKVILSESEFAKLAKSASPSASPR